MSIEDEIAAGLNAVEIEAALDDLAHKAANYAKDLAPVFDADRDKRSTPGIGDPEDYKNSIQVKPAGVGHRRVESDDPKAVWIEIGTRHMPEYAVFTKTAKYFGGDGPTILADAGVQHTQSHLRGELEMLAKLKAEGAAAHHIAAQRSSVNQARIARSAAFKAARRGRRSR